MSSKRRQHTSLHQFSQARGFSILESLIALAFLALAAFAVLSSFLFATRLDTKKQSRQEASLIALDSMEEARVELSRDFDADITLAPTAAPQSAQFTLSRTQKFLSQDLGIRPGSLKEVTVTVSWDDSKGPQKYELTERFLRR
ncbi:MAG TPA: hypothetical protein EYO33_05270 [Phycisphaerales bacterium]|nr:hypothetical protein [Phycisphaerales bacterium]